MLKIINQLAPFFKDNYRRIAVREYARIINVTPPTSSKLLKGFQQEGLLKREDDRQFIYYYPNKDSSLFIDLARIYWKTLFEKACFIDYLERECVSPVIILFGSLSKAEAKLDSDIDIALFTSTQKKLDLSVFEKKFKREIQLFVFKRRDDVKNDGLLHNILNGYKLKGNW